MFYYTYVLQSLLDHKLYIGWTPNIKKRFADHCLGKVTSTKHRRPLKLVYFEACLDKASAIKREKQLKSGFGRKYLQNRLKYNSENA